MQKGMQILHPFLVVHLAHTFLTQILEDSAASVSVAASATE